MVQLAAARAREATVVPDRRKRGEFLVYLPPYADEMPLRRKVRPAGAAARRAALRWWLLSLAATGAAVTAAAALFAVALHFSGSGPGAGASSASSSSSGAPYRLSQPREAEELRWEQEVAPPQLASPQSRKVIDWPCSMPPGYLAFRYRLLPPPLSF